MTGSGRLMSWLCVTHRPTSHVRSERPQIASSKAASVTAVSRGENGEKSHDRSRFMSSGPLRPLRTSFEPSFRSRSAFPRTTWKYHRTSLDSLFYLELPRSLVEKGSRELNSSFTPNLPNKVARFSISNVRFSAIEESKEESVEIEDGLGLVLSGLSSRCNNEAQFSAFRRPEAAKWA
ncbi:hypothetical protein KM043_002818 [Ampulex compressa]|nr:hypothetical protein KM043_002818 [Ampulex compressa]